MIRLVLLLAFVVAPAAIASPLAAFGFPDLGTYHPVVDDPSCEVDGEISRCDRPDVPLADGVLGTLRFSFRQGRLMSIGYRTNGAGVSNINLLNRVLKEFGVPHQKLQGVLIWRTPGYLLEYRTRADGRVEFVIKQ
jgi:hypothetical protein